jgi:hypothetical protein
MFQLYSYNYLDKKKTKKFYLFNTGEKFCLESLKSN